MTVHNIAEYVKYHQEKLRQQQQAAHSLSSSTPSPASTSAAPQKSRGGVNQIHSMASFQSAVIGGSSKTIVVVDYFATWCGPCKVIAPKIAAMSNEFDGKVSFVKVDVDEVSDVAGEQGIRAMPTFAIFKDGEKVDEVVGANEMAIRQKITALL